MNVDKEMTPTPTTDEIRTAARAWAFAKDKSQGRAVILFEETSSSIRQYIDDMERNTFTMILLAQLMESLERSSAHNTSAEALESYLQLAVMLMKKNPATLESEKVRRVCTFIRIVFGMTEQKETVQLATLTPPAPSSTATPSWAYPSRWRRSITTPPCAVSLRLHFRNSALS